MRIGKLEIKPATALAPMAGVNDVAFRILCKRFGAGLVYTEMVNANAVFRGNKATLKKLVISAEERPVAVQLFAAKKEVLVEATKIVTDLGADIIDLNLGCPDIKVVRQGAGSALLKRPAKIEELISAMVSCTDVPITAKIRIGLVSYEGLKTAKIVEKAGASAIAVHGRTVDQGYSGKADWDAIKEIKDNVSIPVIGNGDVFCAKDAISMIEHTKCDAVMIGRGAIGNPQIFSEIDDLLCGRRTDQISPEKKISIFFEYHKLAQQYGVYNFPGTKRMAMYLTKGLHQSTNLRQKINAALTIEEIQRILTVLS
jgi:tRNA-dihydrouridine synthase B